MPTFAYPAVRDTKAAVRHVRANAKKYNIDADKIAMFGESAGSCSAMGVAMTFESDYKGEISAEDDPTLPTTNLGQSSTVAAVLDHWGSDDIATQLTARDGRPRYTRSNAPVGIFHGTADTLVPFKNALQIDAGYNASGVFHRIFPLAGQGHGCWNARTENMTQDEAGLSFLASVMGFGERGGQGLQLV